MTAFEEHAEIFCLWRKYLGRDKRSFYEYFVEEHGFEIKEGIGLENLTHLCEKLIPIRKEK